MPHVLITQTFYTAYLSMESDNDTNSHQNSVEENEPEQVQSSNEHVQVTKPIEEQPATKKQRSEKQQEVFKRAQAARAQAIQERKKNAGKKQEVYDYQPNKDLFFLYSDLIEKQNRHIETLLNHSVSSRSFFPAPELSPRMSYSEKKNNHHSVQADAPVREAKRKQAEDLKEEREDTDVDTIEIKPSRENPKRVATPRVNSMNHMLKLLGY